MSKAPRWFTKELEMIDGRFYPLWNELYQYWEIKCRMKIDATAEDTKNIEKLLHIRAENPTIAVEKRLNEEALTGLRRRKYLRLKYGTGRSDIDDIETRNREAKAKAERLGIELIAEGLILQDQIENKRKMRFDMAAKEALA